MTIQDIRAGQIQSGDVGLIDVDLALTEADRRIYTDPTLFEIEKHAVFARSWLYACHEHELADAGDYVTATIGDQPVVVCRSRSGELLAFFNSCAHRGAEVAAGRDGNCGNNFRCMYHGWTYDTDGKLIGVPYPQAYGPEFDKSDFGLTPIHAAAFAGLVFVAIDPVAPTIEEFLGEAGPHLERLLGGTEVLGRAACVFEANWKTWHENFADNYHPEFVHNWVHDFEYGYADQGANYELEPGHGLLEWPMSPPEFERYAAGLEKLSGIQVDPMANPAWGEPPFEPDFSIQQYVMTLFPNFDLQLFLFGGVRVIQVLRPLAVDRTIVEIVCVGLVDDDPVTRQWKLERAADLQGSWGKLSPDDIEAVERTQSGCRSGARRVSNMGRGLAPGTVGETRDEYALRSFHKAWRSYMDPNDMNREGSGR
jgi:phenylpropionate dioxygenase-like ring-hydroxylating dioxygenase large terminal subunit